MTELERTIINDDTREELKRLNSNDIGELMELAQKVEHPERIGNVLFPAIVKAFVLGYHRGKTDYEIRNYISPRRTVYFVDSDSYIKKAEVIKRANPYVRLRCLDANQSGSEDNQNKTVNVSKRRIFPTKAAAVEYVDFLKDPH